MIQTNRRLVVGGLGLKFKGKGWSERKVVLTPRTAFHVSKIWVEGSLGWSRLEYK